MTKHATLLLGLCFFTLNVMHTNAQAGPDDKITQTALETKALQLAAEIVGSKIGRNICAYGAGFLFLPVLLSFCYGSLGTFSVLLLASSACLKKSYTFHQKAETLSKEVNKPFCVKRSSAGMALNGALGLGSCVAICAAYTL